MRLAVLGLGNMGVALAHRLLDQDHQVTVWNRSPGKAASLTAAGAREAGSPADAVTGAEIVLVILSDDAAVRSVVLGDDGVLPVLEADAVLVNMSTVSPELARELATAAGSGSVLEAPILGGPAQVGQGQGQILLGGDEATAARLDPLWRQITTRFSYCGAAGTAVTMKIVSNLLLIGGLGLLSEGVATAQATGIPDDLIRTLFSESAVVAPAGRMRLDKIIGTDHSGWFSTLLARKDLRLASDLAAGSGLRVRIAQAADEMLTSVIDSGREGEDVAAIVEAVRAQGTRHRS